MRRSTLTTVLDVLGLILLVACAFFVWPPAALGIGGIGCFVLSWAIASGRA